MGRKLLMGAALGAVISAVLLFVTGTATADSAGKLVSRGNRSYEKGDYEKAVEYYEKASVREPESPMIAFNLGNVYYRKQEFDKARDYFEEAALRARDLSLEARAWYNMGNSVFNEGGRQTDSDIEKALKLYEESVRFYSTALQKDPGFDDAAYNIEVARLVIKDLLDRIRKQQEQQKAQQEEMKEAVDSLVALIERERDVVDRSDSLDNSGSKYTDQWLNRLGAVERKQGGIIEGTDRLMGRIGSLFPDEQPPQVTGALSHLDTSITNQDDAMRDFEAKAPGKGWEDGEKALEQMEKALEALTKGNQDQQGGGGGQQEQQEQQEQPRPQDQPRQKEQMKRDEEAKDILDEEKENRRKRAKAAREGYRSVDKDW